MTLGLGEYPSALEPDSVGLENLSLLMISVDPLKSRLATDYSI
jgi:hypothetical protein